MKQSEALRIRGLIAARQPAPTVQEATIDGTRMLVICGDKVDTVIRYSQGGSADMPQLSSYPEVAESAAYADERLAKQRASGRSNRTGEGVDWPRNWKLSAAKGAGIIWYQGKPPGIGPTAIRPLISSAPRSVSTYGSIKSNPESIQKLANVARALSQLDRVKYKLEELKKDARDLEKPDFVWRSLVESFSSMGNSRGYEGLFGDPSKYEKITFEALSLLSPEGRLHVLRDTLSAGIVRMSDKKAVWLAADYEKIKTMGGPVEAKARMLAQPGRDAKITFLKSFDGIGDKYARNIFMNVYHPEFRESIAVDSRIDSVLEKLGMAGLKGYVARENFVLEAARMAGLEGWYLDRLIYNFQNDVLAGL